MAEGQPEAQTAETPAPKPQSSNGQLTSTVPTTERKKDPARQAAGKAAAEKTRQAREAQKKELEDSKAELAKYKEKEAASAAPPTSGQEAAAENSFSFGTVLALGGLIIGAASLYYQREAAQESKSSAPKSAPCSHVPSKPAPAPRKKGGIRNMDQFLFEGLHVMNICNGERFCCSAAWIV